MLGLFRLFFWSMGPLIFCLGPVCAFLYNPIRDHLYKYWASGMLYFSLLFVLEGPLFWDPYSFIEFKDMDILVCNYSSDP